MAFGADHMQAAGLTHPRLLLLHHGVVFRLDPGDRISQGLDLRIVGGGFLGCGGDTLLEVDYGEGAITPFLHQIPSQLSQALISVVSEGAGVETFAATRRRRQRSIRKTSGPTAL